MVRKQKLLLQSISHLQVIEQEVVKVAKTYLRRNHGYSPIAKRTSFMNANYITAKDNDIHAMVLYELKGQADIIDRIRKHDLTSRLTIEYRLIKSCSVNRILKQSQQQGMKISECTL